jgi:hypothetical protein
VAKATKFLSIFLEVTVLGWAISGCAPQPRYSTRPPPTSTARVPPASTLPPQPAQQSPPPSIPPDAKIREQDIPSKSPVTPPVAKTGKAPVRQGSEGESRGGAEPVPAAPPPLVDDSSLLAKITPGTPPQRAASLRLTEEGRKILESGDPARALTRLEKTIVIDSTNAYGYFYLALAQYRLGRFKESLNFLDVAESRLGAEPFWLSEIHALRGENFRAQGQLQRAEASYNQAVRLNSGNRIATEALARMQADPQPASK